MVQIQPIPALFDNYIWLLTRPGASEAAVVDPGEAQPVLDRLASLGLRLSGILLTHHHRDHIEGVEALRDAFPRVRVFGPRDPRIPTVTDPVDEGARVRIPGFEEPLWVWAIPGHTATHVGYGLGDHFFCGDTLFGAGCGRVFDGTPEQLADSLARIARLPPHTQLYCAHEYSLANLGFAAWVEPDHEPIQHRIDRSRRQRREGRPTVPSRLEDERATNPFLRTQVPRVRQAAERFAGHPLEDHRQIFAALRRWKDEEYDA